MFSDEFVFTFVRQGLLFLHLLLFAYAIVQVLSADFDLIRAKPLDTATLMILEKRVGIVLIGLWLTGAGLVVLEVKGDLALLIGQPKLAAKLLVVAVLTLNGLALHWLAFPRIRAPRENPRRCAVICSVLGSISTVSWLYAAFIGSARLLAPFMTLEMFIALYLAVAATGVMIALTLVRPRVERLISERRESLADRADRREDAHATAGLAR